MYWHIVIQVLFDLNVSKIYGRAIPVQAWTSPEFSMGLRSPDFHTVSTCTSCLYPHRKYSWYSLLSGWVDPWVVMRSGGLSQWKIPTPLAIEPATFGIVTQCLNQLHHCVPQLTIIVDSYWLKWNWLYCPYCKMFNTTRGEIFGVGREMFAPVFDASLVSGMLKVIKLMSPI